MLSDYDLLLELSGSDHLISPVARGAIQPSSIDVRLSQIVKKMSNHAYGHIDPFEKQDKLYDTIVIEDSYMLHPGEFVLGATIETVNIPSNMAARLDGKSSLGRLGLLCHSTAGYVDPGFSGTITLELSNSATLPIKLTPGMFIGQLTFWYLHSPCVDVYGSVDRNSKYQHQIYPEESRYFENNK